MAKEITDILNLILVKLDNLENTQQEMKKEIQELKIEQQEMKKEIHEMKKTVQRMDSEQQPIKKYIESAEPTLKNAQEDHCLLSKMKQAMCG